MDVASTAERKVCFLYGLLMISLLLCINRADAQPGDPTGNVNLSPFEKWRSAYECMQNVSHSCPDKYTLNDSGWLNVTDGDAGDFCTGGCFEHTKAVLTCIQLVKDDYKFVNRATVQDVTNFIANGCASEDSQSTSNRFPLRQNLYTPPSASSTKIHRSIGRSMRTIRSNLYQTDNSCSFVSVPDNSGYLSENLTESVIDMRLGELASKTNDAKSVKSTISEDDYLNVSQAFSDFSVCSSDISGELQRLASLPSPENILRQPNENNCQAELEPEPEPCLGFLQRENFSTEIIESISPEDLQPTVKICIDGLQSSSVAIKRSAAAKLRLLAKNRSDNRVLIGESGAVPALVPLLKCSDPWTQEHSVTALLNLSLHENNKTLITNAGAIKSLVYVLKTGTETSKQNAACALMSLALIEENKSSIGACGAIPPLVSLLIYGSSRGKKDALTTLYKLCSLKQNKERAVSAGAVRPLVGMLAGQGEGMAEKAMVVLSLLAGIAEGREAIVEENGIAALVEAIEDGSVKGKEFAVLTLLQLCAESVKNRGLLVREGGIPPLVALSQTGSVRAKHKAETLLGYLREPRQEGPSSSP